MKALSKEQLDHLRTLLMHEQAEVERRLKGFLGLHDSLNDQTGELSAYDNHPADIGTELFEREKDLALKIHSEEQLLAINNALLAMDKGYYGLCTVCHQPIPYERLLVVPSAMTCKDHTLNPSITEKRPVEEQRRQAPFGETGLDERPLHNSFDGENAWQIVSAWGTSNSPEMAEDNEITDYNELEGEPDENDGFVESLESFLATDIYGKQVTFVRNNAYREYIDNIEGDTELESKDDSK